MTTQPRLTVRSLDSAVTPAHFGVIATWPDGREERFWSGSLRSCHEFVTAWRANPTPDAPPTVPAPSESEPKHDWVLYVSIESVVGSSRLPVTDRSTAESVCALLGWQVDHCFNYGTYDIRVPRSVIDAYEEHRGVSFTVSLGGTTYHIDADAP